VYVQIKHNLVFCSFVDQFAVQSCFLGRYGQEIGSDQFGSTIMASGINSSDNTQDVILRLSNIAVSENNQPPFSITIYFS
jgi:hypothetical protein